jgi:hypothetical protein
VTGEVESQPSGNTNGLTLIGEAAILLLTGHRCIRLQDFALFGNATDSQLLSSLIRHAAYEDGAFPIGPTTFGACHGQYRLDFVTGGTYANSDADAALTVLDWFCALNGGLPTSALRDKVDSQVRLRLLQSNRIYELPQLKRAQYDFGLRLEVFREFVAIRYDAHVLSVITMLLIDGDSVLRLTCGCS